jgi:hypothetical protein
MRLGTMRSRSSNTAICALLAAMAVGCGGEPPPPQLIPAESAARLERLLDEADQQFRDGECDELETTLEQVTKGVDQIPDGEVDRRLLASLDSGTQRLTELADRCEPPKEVTITETAPPPVPTTAPTVPTAPPTTEEPTTEEQDQPKPEEDQRDKEQPSKPQDQQDSDSGSGSEPKPPKEDPCEGAGPRC